MKILCKLGIHKWTRLGNSNFNICPRCVKFVSPWDGIPDAVRVEEERKLHTLCNKLKVEIHTTKGES